MSASLDPISAVSSPDPYAYYARLVIEKAYYFDEALSMWIASSRAEVERVLADRMLAVRPANEPVPAGILQTPIGRVFSQMARWTEGDYHDRVKASLSTLLGSLDWERVAVAQTVANRWMTGLDPSRERFLTDVMYGVPVLVVASLIGIPATDETLRWASAFVEALRANANHEAIALGTEGVNALARAMAESNIDERTANLIGLLFQSYDATAGLIGNTILHAQRGAAISDVGALVDHVIAHDPAVHNTRRFGKNGTTLVVLAAAKLPFGGGRHACPADLLARQIAIATCEHLFEGGLDPAGIEHLGYVASPNCRIPRLRLR